MDEITLPEAGSRFGKSTHISMISNSVTYLRSYTNYAIANIAENSAAISLETPREHRYRRAESRCLCIERRYCRIEWRVFHDVLLVVHDVLRRFTMYHNVLKVFHDALLYLTMFYDV